MTDSLRHRGPDDAGLWCDQEAGIALGHRRLSILDLSPEGHQPMVSACGRYVLVFNGEIYNYAELRRDCERVPRFCGAGWRGHSDTEVALEAIAAWGLREALGRFNGMFALALWDRAERVLHLSRDRIGEKPLYYGWIGETFLFASELRAMRAHPGSQFEVDRRSLGEFLAYGYVAAPATILRGVAKLLPGSILSVDGSGGSSRETRLEQYWSVEQAFREAVEKPFRGDAQDAVLELERLLEDSVRLRMASDVPLGGFLSGGVDSSTVVALMQAQSERRVDTFCIGFRDPAYDEAPFAAKVAEHIGTRHHSLYVTAEDALSVVPQLGGVFDEPFGDSSQIPTWLLASLTRKHVTVALSGDGGDELFAGYTRYDAGQRLWQWMAPIPVPVRRVIARVLSRVPVRALDRLFAGAGPMLSRYSRGGAVGDKVRKLSGLLGASSPDILYDSMNRAWPVAASPVVGAAEEAARGRREPAWGDGSPPYLMRMMLQDLSYYLPDDILTKVDRVTMNVSLEGRVPLLDHRIIEFSLGLPEEISRHDGQGKWPLRRVLARHVPEALTARPKRGFGVPLAAWLRGPLRPWAEDLLDESRLRREGYLDPGPILSRWREHVSGSRNWQHSLWNVLMYQSWLEAGGGIAADPVDPARCPR